MNLFEELKELGADVDEALDRVMGDTAIYEMMLGLFIGTVRDNPIRLEEFESADLDPLIQKVHMFKGVTGNLSFSPLFAGYQEILCLLRAGQAKAARADYEKLQPVQAAIVGCLQRHAGGTN